MTTDGTIIAYAAIAFCAFLISQMIVFRLTHQDDALRWLTKLYCLMGAVLCLVAVYDAPLALESFLLYSGFSFVYTLCVFSPIEASLTLRILSEIDASGRSGITRAGILRRYNKKIIVRRRIERFERSGELRVKRGKWYRSGKLTAFSIREHMTATVNFLLLLLSDS